VPSAEIDWPPGWQPEAADALTPYLGSDHRLRIVVDEPKTAIHGTVVEGHVYVDGRTPKVIHDCSGRPDVFPWDLLSGPVLRIELLRPRRPPLVIFAHADWSPPAQDVQSNLKRHS
jgi:hypothetical protein